MQYVFEEVNTLDKRCYTAFELSEDLLMEHAALSMAKHIQDNFDTQQSILIVCGKGNNGADGIALARLLYTQYDVKLYLAFEPKSKMAKLQYERILKLGIEPVSQLIPCDITVDCLFGSGFTGKLDETSLLLIQELNDHTNYKLSCDIPSGINKNGQIQQVAFYAHTTITMGALKCSLFSDEAKEHVGNIYVANLGIPRNIYETSSDVILLEDKDMRLPLRNTQNTHKGKYGHLSVIVGEKAGAGILASKAAFCFGAGLVSVMAHSCVDVPEYIMQSNKLPSNITALVLGMGLGRFEQEEILQYLSMEVKKVVDADLFYESFLVQYLSEDMVLTPHPKEFCALLALCDMAHIDVKTLQKNRLKYVQAFCAKYPNITLLLKGANVLIGQNKRVYINAMGSAVLSKGGSGDVLAGLVASLLAQGYESLEACISASLAHTKAASQYKGNNYSMTPNDLIQEIKYL